MKRREFITRAAGLATAATLPALAPAQGTVTEGLDVSHWQGNINWPAVAAAGIKFCFCKATQDTAFVDSKFATNWAAMKANGIVRGAYHFAKPAIDPIAQARHFYQTVKPSSGDLPLCLDFEDADGQTATYLRNWAQAFCQELKRRIGRPPVIYTGFYFWRDTAGNSPFNYGCPLWMARWGTTPLPLPAAWSNWTFWQYTSTGSVSGISGNVDRNQFNGSVSALDAVRMP
jgi:lysozyme